MQDWDCVNKLRSHHPIRITIHNIPDIVTRWWKNIAAMLDDVASGGDGNDGGDGDEDVGTDVCNINSLSISTVTLYRSAFKKHCSDMRVKIPESIFQSRKAVESENEKETLLRGKGNCEMRTEYSHHVRYCTVLYCTLHSNGLSPRIVLLNHICCNLLINFFFL